MQVLLIAGRGQELPRQNALVELRLIILDGARKRVAGTRRIAMPVLLDEVHHIGVAMLDCDGFETAVLRQCHEAPIGKMLHCQPRELLANRVDFGSSEHRVGRLDHEAKALASALLLVYVGRGANPPDGATFRIADRRGPRKEPAIPSFAISQAKLVLVLRSVGDGAIPTIPRFCDVIGMHDADLSTTRPKAIEI